MRAVIYNKYGPPGVLKMVEIEKPEPADNEVLIKIHATTVTSGDVRLRSFNFPLLAWLPVRLIFGLFAPKKKILGHEFSGIVEAVGKDVTKFKTGDEVFATTSMFANGSYAEYICMPEQRKRGGLGLKPGNLSFQEAAALPVGGMTALYLLEKARLSKGQAVLIYGASGSVGSYAIQIAKARGTKVVAVCSGSNSDMVKSLGADDVIDYRKEDYSLTEHKFDIVFDAVGKTSKSKAKKILKQGGQFTSVKALTTVTQDHLNKIKELAEEQNIRPYIDKSFSLAHIAAAHDYVDKGRKKGNVVIEIVN